MNLEIAAATILTICNIERQKHAYFYSYFPRTIREWNALAAAIVEALLRISSLGCAITLIPIRKYVGRACSFISI